MVYSNIPEGGYNLTTDPQAVPQPLLNAEIHRVFIEFLGFSTEGLTATEIVKMKNHAMIKVDFTTRIDGYDGARLDMIADFDRLSSGPGPNGEPSYKPGALKLKPVSYLVQSRRSIYTFELHKPTSYNLRTLVNFFLHQHMQEFHFITIDEKYFGCRDFVMQACYQMWRNNYVGHQIIQSIPAQPSVPIQSIFDALGLRYNSVGSRTFTASPADKGHFFYYQRVEDGARMPYHGTTRAAQIHQAFPN